MTPQQLIKAREQLSMTQQQLARELEMDRAHLAGMERGYPGRPITKRTALAVECLLRRRGLVDGLGHDNIER